MRLRSCFPTGHLFPVLSPEHRYWSITDGAFEYGGDESLSRTMERAPFSIYRLARAIARDDSDVEVRYEMVSLTGSNERPALSLFAPPD
jgi:hypothetical protein